MEAKEQDPELCAAWFRKLANYRAEQLIFLDESGINTKLGRRTHGWGPKGQVLRAPVKSGRAENLSLLPAFTIDGYIVMAVYRGGVNAELYEDFIRYQVLRKCTPWPGLRSVIVMDNCKIHHETVCSMLNMFNCQETINVKQIVEDSGCKCEFLPPYSPDFNPIKYTFSVIKQHFKRDYDITGDEDINELAEKAIKVVKNVVTSEMAMNQFRHCRIQVE